MHMYIIYMYIYACMIMYVYLYRYNKWLTTGQHLPYNSFDLEDFLSVPAKNHAMVLPSL